MARRWVLSLLNSVSFCDGGKFYNSHEDYRRMREVSDQICREYEISVIEKPQKRGKNYGQFAAEKNGKPTHTQMIRNDIDRAVAASLTEPEFFCLMREMGYTITTHGKSGAPLKHPTLTPVGSPKNYRFDTLGEEYALDRILLRVRSNDRRLPLFYIPERKHYRMKMPRKPMKKLTGLRALYFRYCYELGIIIKHPNRMKRVSYLLREDVIKLDRYIAEVKMLLVHRIETIQDLEVYRDSLNQKVSCFITDRNELRNRLKRANRIQDESEIKESNAALKRISSELKNARKEVDYCAEIADRAAQIYTNLTELINNKNILRKERYTDEYPSRSSRSSGQNHARWQ